VPVIVYCTVVDDILPMVGCPMWALGAVEWPDPFPGWMTLKAHESGFSVIRFNFWYMLVVILVLHEDPILCWHPDRTVSKRHQPFTLHLLLNSAVFYRFIVLSW